MKKISNKKNEIDKQNLGKNPALHFFLLVYGLSSPLWLAELFIKNNSLPLNIPITDILAAFTPLIAACILIYKTDGKTGVLKLLSKIFDYRKINLKWWLVILVLPIIIFSSIYLLLVGNGHSIPNKWIISIYSVPLLFIFFFLGAVGEEVGYMGYAVEPLQRKYNALWTSIIIGIPWIVWHYPSMLQQGRNMNFFFWGTLGTVAFRTIFVWVFNNTNNSLFACILLHCLYNTGRVLFPTDGQYNPLVDYPMIHYSVIVIIASVVTLLWGQRTLSNFIGQKNKNASR